MQGIWRRRELQWRVPDSQSLLPGSNIFFGRVFSDLSHAFGFQNVCTMCLPNCYSVRFSSILYDSGFKTRILSISKLSSSKKGLIASLAITYNLTLKHVEAAHKKSCKLHSFRDSKMSDVGVVTEPQGHPKWSRSPEQVPKTDRIPSMAPIWIPLICWMAKFLLLQEHLQMNNFFIAYWDPQLRREKTCKKHAIAVPSAGGVVQVHSCNGWMPPCLASRMNISFWSRIFRTFFPGDFRLVAVVVVFQPTDL